MVAGQDAASFTIRIDEGLPLAGKEVDEVASKANWTKKLPEALREKLEAAGFKLVNAGEPADLILRAQATDVEWTGRFWDARGNIAVVLAPPAPDAATVDGGAPPALSPDPPPPAAGAAPPDTSAVAHATAHFDGINFDLVAEAVSGSIADQLARSAELSQWVRAKRAKEEAAKAPPPPPPAPPPPPPAKGLEASEIKPVLVSLRAAYRGCYDAVLVNNPTVTGSLTLKIAIQPSGAVDSVATDAPPALNDTGLSGCVADVTKAAKFPKAEGPSTFSYPIEFAADPAPTVNKGGLDVAEVQKAIHGEHEKLRACFDAGVKKDPGFSGSLKLKFAVDLKGKVPKVEAAKGGALKDADVQKCVFDVVKGTTFPKPKRWTEVVYPIEFRAN